MGGWEEVKTLRGGGPDRLKGDERIPGESEFVLSILAEGGERLERKYELKSKEYDLRRVERCAGEVLGFRPKRYTLRPN